MGRANTNPTPAHTPGPWKVQEVIGTWIGTVGDPYGHGQMHVADVRGWGHLTGSGACRLEDAAAIEIQSANARLIAAAPDLLAALKAVSETDDDCPFCDRGRLRNPEKTHWPECPFRRAQAVIAKAEGAA